MRKNMQKQNKVGLFASFRIRRFSLFFMFLIVSLLSSCGAFEKTYNITVIDSITNSEQIYTLDKGDYVSAYYATDHEGYYVNGFMHDGSVYGINESFEATEDTTITILYEPYLYSVAYYERDETEVIDHIYSDFNKMFLITSTNRVLALGSNQKGELGLSHEEYITEPFDITPQFDLMDNEIISDIDINGNAVIFTTNQNRYFILGETKYSAKRDMYQMPKDITPDLGLASNETIQEVSGTLDYYLLTSLGRVLKVLYINQVLNVTDVTPSFELESGDKIEHIYCGLTSFATSENGQIFGWGLNNKGQVGDNHIDYSTVDYLEYDDSVSEANTVQEPINITSNFELHDGEYIRNIDTRQDISYFVTSEDRLFVTGHLDIEDVFYDNQGINFQYTNIPVDVTNLLGLEEGETIIDSYSMSNFVIYVTNTNRKIGVGQFYVLIPDVYYLPDQFMDVTEYLPENIEDIIFYKTYMILNGDHQIYAIGRFDDDTYQMFKDISDVDNIVTVKCSPYGEDYCKEFDVPTDITEIYDLGYKLVSSEIIPYGDNLTIPNNDTEMYESLQGSAYTTMPNKNLFFVKD